MEKVKKEQEYEKMTCRLWEEEDPRRTIKFNVKAMLMSEGIKGVSTMSWVDLRGQGAV